MFFLILALPILVSAQLQQLPLCGSSCVGLTATVRGCVLATPDCICPGLPDIRLCLRRQCRGIDEFSTSNTIISQFCANIPSSSTTTVLPTNPITTTSLTIGNPPITTESPSTTLSTTISLPTTSSSTTAILPTTSTTTSISTSSTTTPVVPTTSTPRTTQAAETVVVFSTQFAPPTPFGAAIPNFSINGLFITLLSFIFGTFML